MSRGRHVRRRYGPRGWESVWSLIRRVEARPRPPKRVPAATGRRALVLSATPTTYRGVLDALGVGR